ncbi:DNA polymerase II [Parashewanella spongiae]|uniref:DNA polymerase n=1 Tax=Parashewanella spongiae TaxID=342950 RepID=A0A3A6UA94_9GAMM|nr:DNA polymerase II [Parashewanella spongiae]MCL1077820.1 DNA polymerase II [Parashewanella spongiae]RJY18881.1 DNA polymerase II [Parashewanella spongiae]
MKVLKGLILTRRCLTQGSHSLLEYYILTNDGAVRVVVDNKCWMCFCLTSDSSKLKNISKNLIHQIKPLQLTNFEKQPVSVLYFFNRQSFKTMQRLALDLSIPLYEADIKPENRFLIERFVHFDAEFLGDFSQKSDDGSKSFIATKARKASTINLKPKCISLDFECSPFNEIYSVGLYADGYRKVIMVGESENNSPDYVFWVADEQALIFALIEWFKNYDPDVIIGWAVVVFDLALLSKRAEFHHIPLTLGRNQQLLSWKVDGKYRPETLSLPGRVVLDGIDWLKAAFYSFESFSLENVSRELLDEGKAIDNVKGRGTKINEMFENDKLSLAHYNITDCRLVWDIFEKTKLLDFAIARSRLTGLEFGRVGASIAAFNNLYLPHLHRHGYVAPGSPASNGLESPGGYVMDSVPGLYKNVILLDFKSLYPSIIRTFLIDPKGLIEGLLTVDDQKSVDGFLGARFARENPILPSLIAELTSKRELAKKSGDAPLSQAIKIIMNSLYGVLGSTGCVFHDAKLASSITMRGHQIMKQTQKWIENEGCQVIYGDTDSTFIWIGDSINENEAKQKGHDLVSIINRNWNQELKKTYNLECFLELEFERLYEQFFMPTLRGSELGSKKRYVGTFRNEQQQIELIFKGMENVRNDWSKLAKRVQFELYTRLFEGRPLSEFLSEQISLLRMGKLDYELLFSKKLSRDLDKYSAKASPHVKVAQSLLTETGDEAYRKRGTRIDYLITVLGPQALQLKTAEIDYQYYVDKQLKPIAEPVFAAAGESLTNVLSNQLNLL